MDYHALVSSVGDPKYLEACEAARAVASLLDYGRGGTTFDSNIPLELFDQVWKSELPCEKKLGLVFRLYDEMPCYSYVASLSFRFPDLGREGQDRFWSWVRSTLSSGDQARTSPLAYSLWCDFFENAGVVDEAWAQLTRTDIPDAALELVLVHSGPVPFRLKRDLYRKLLPKEQWHYHIFRSLLHSAFDVYGEIDDEEARRIFAQLVLPPETEHLDQLRAKLSWATDITSETSPTDS
jgi:hypothetical protein